MQAIDEYAAADLSGCFVVRRKVEFSETDMAGLVHFAQYFRYVEYAEARLFEHLAEPLIGQEPEGLVGWPRVRASCDYRAPLFFGDTVEVRLFVREVKIRALEFGFEIFRVREPMQKVARGKMTTVRVVRPVGAPPSVMEPTGISESLVAKLARYTNSGR